MMIRFMFVTGVIAVITIVAILLKLELATVFGLTALCFAIDNRFVLAAHQGALKAIIGSVGGVLEEEEKK